MDKRDAAIIWLSICLSVCQWQWLVAERKASYLQGQADLYQAQASYNIDAADPVYPKPSKKEKHNHV